MTLSARTRQLTSQAQEKEGTPGQVVWCSAIRAGYSTAMGLLAQERDEVRLAVSTDLIFTGGEWLPPMELKRIESAFRCPLREVYGATEFLYAAIGCAHGWLHANADWMVLKPVDEEYRHMLPGETSHTVLLTNLAYRVQPISRYDLGDSVTLRVRLEMESGADTEKAWGGVERRLGEYLSSRGLAPGGIERDRKPPRADPKSGKFRQVWAEV